MTAELETTSDVKKSLLRILRQWNGVIEVVPLGNRWQGGTLLLQPAEQTAYIVSTITDCTRYQIKRFQQIELFLSPCGQPRIAFSNLGLRS